MHKGHTMLGGYWPMFFSTTQYDISIDVPIQQWIASEICIQMLAVIDLASHLLQEYRYTACRQAVCS